MHLAFDENYNNLYKIEYPKLNYNNNNLHTLTNAKFRLLLKNNIDGIDMNILESNITKTRELFDYLTNHDIKYQYPIQELIMGSGESSTITLLLCLLLAEYLINMNEYNSSIYVVMSEFLISQSFEIMMKNLLPINSLVEISINNSSPLLFQIL